MTEVIWDPTLAMDNKPILPIPMFGVGAQE